MPKASKKKKEKKADFAKKKLKVGKTKEKPTNFTDTSFRSKAVTLPTQFTDAQAANPDEAPVSSTLDQQTLDHHLALTKHYSATNRTAALTALTDILKKHPPGPLHLSPIITALAPLILDDEPKVRQALLTLLESLAPNEVTWLTPHTPLLLLYISSAMTHIAPGVRGYSTRFLHWLLEVSSNAVVSAWTLKVWTGFAGLLGWSVPGLGVDNGKRVNNTSGLGGKISRGKHLKCLTVMLRMGLHVAGEGEGDVKKERVPNRCVHPAYALPGTTNPYAHLSLFTPAPTPSTAGSTFKSSTASTSGPAIVASPESPHGRYLILRPYLPGIIKWLSDSAQDDDRELKAGVREIAGVLNGVINREEVAEDEGGNGDGLKSEWEFAKGKIWGNV